VSRILTGGFSRSGRRRDGPAVASSSYARRWPVVGLRSGSPAGARVKTASWWLGNDPRPVDQACKVINW
jgi:hypothetical protein